MSMSSIIAIDPGNEKSALVEWTNGKIVDASIAPNDDMLRWLGVIEEPSQIAIEMVACYGMPVGATVFQTCVWIGRFQQVAVSGGHSVRFIFRKDVKMHHCGNMRAKDSNIRQALIDKYGPQGTKKAPGLTYPLSKDLWSAFAIATMITEQAQIQPINQA